MNNKLLKLALDAHLMNYVEHETPRHYFIDGHADEETVQEFAELIIQECIKSIHATTDESIDLGRSLGENASWIENDIKKQFGVE